VAKLTTLLAGMAGWMEKNSTTVQILIGVVAALAVSVLAINGALAVWNAATVVSTALQALNSKALITTRIQMIALSVAQKATAAAQWLLNAAMSANPVMLLVIAIVALVAIIVIAYKKSETFRKIIDALWAGIKSGAKAAAAVLKTVWNTAITWFKKAWQLAFAAVKTYINIWKAIFVAVFNYIKQVIKLVVAIFKGDWKGAFAALKGIVQVFKQFFISIFRALPGPVQDILRKIKDGIVGAFNFIKDKASGITDKITAPFEKLYDWVLKAIDAIGDLISKISDIHMPSFSLPDINPFSAIAGGGGGATGLTAQPGLSRTVMRGAKSTPATAGGTGNTFIIQGALDPDAVARQIDQILKRRARRIGAA
jgi:hypothetical protein